MQKLFSNQEKKSLSQVDKSEKDLQQFLCGNWKDLFPEYIFITQEFQLKGAVHGSGSSGRIDILAYNPVTKRFVIFELKKNYDKDVLSQASGYRYYIKSNFPAVYLEALQKHKAELPNKTEVNEKDVEIILVAKQFMQHQKGQAEEDDLITLIQYNWFENDFLLLDYVTNTPNTIDPDKNEYEGMDWDSIVATIRPTIREQLQVLPVTQENRAKIEALLNQVMKKKRIVLLDLLEEQLGIGTENASDTSKKKEPYEKKDWHYIVKTIQNARVREALQTLPFPPATKEQYDELKGYVEQVPNVHKRTVLQKRLDALEFGTE